VCPVAEQSLPRERLASSGQELPHLNRWLRGLRAQFIEDR
jgi:hypothetical protein